jgi:hypothetical protein
VIVLVGPQGEIRAATNAAATWLDAIKDIAAGRLGLTLYAAVSGARAAAFGTARARVRDPMGGWVTLQASHLVAGEDRDQMVGTVEPTPSLDVVRLMLQAYSVTRREQGVCLELLNGRSTSEIAERLFISPHTSRTTSSPSSRRSACEVEASSSPCCGPDQRSPGPPGTRPVHVSSDESVPVNLLRECTIGPLAHTSSAEKDARARRNDLNCRAEFA